MYVGANERKEALGWEEILMYSYYHRYFATELLKAKFSFCKSFDTLASIVTMAC